MPRFGEQDKLTPGTCNLKKCSRFPNSPEAGSTDCLDCDHFKPEKES